MKLNILVCDWFEGLLPDSLPSFPILFYNLFDSVSPDMTYQLFDVQKGQLPSTLRNDEYYLISGSRSGAYEDLPWIKTLQEFICRANQAKVRLLGICFGHQIIAQSLGGKTEPSPKGWGVGLRTSQIVSKKWRTYFPDGKLSLFYNHNDQVVQLPHGAVRIATSDFCENEAFCIGSHILCFQGHPEYTPEYMLHVSKRNQDTPEKIVRHIEESMRGHSPMGKDVAKAFLFNF